MTPKQKALNLLEARKKAESGLLHADNNEWAGNSNLKHWVNSNRMDEDHVFGDGIGCFIKLADAQFTELAFNDIESVVQWALPVERQLEKCKEQRNDLYERIENFGDAEKNKLIAQCDAELLTVGEKV